jgi:hypothetical protein
MNIVKKNFSFLKNIDNILNISKNELDSKTDELNMRNMIRSIKMIENSVHHFSKDAIYKNFSSLENTQKNIHIISSDIYPLAVTYNKPTDSIILNLSFYDIDSITSLSSKQTYSSLIYGECFRRLVNNKFDMRINYAEPIINFLGTVFIRIFGKEFGLLGSFKNELPKVKFLLATYIYCSFFGLKDRNLYKYASSISGYDYKNIEEQLYKYDFYDIDNFIKSLNELNAMSGITKYSFASKILKFLGLHFLCALEDCSRFMSLIASSSVSGSTLVPSFFYNYNKDAYNKILDVCESIFLKKV